MRAAEDAARKGAGAAPDCDAPPPGAAGPRLPMLERIRAVLAALPPAEQRVARLVLADPQLCARTSVGRLAECAQVSKPTVVRFCRSVGYRGFADFKRKLGGSVEEGVPFVHRAVDARDAAPALIVKVIDNGIAAMLQLRDAAAGAAYAQAVELLAHACHSGGRIGFHGVGNSGIVAQDAQHKFFRLGLSAQACSDPSVQVMAATLLQPGDCLVLISNAGRSRELLDVERIARDRGAATIAITASGSPLARQAQLLLAADHPEDHEHYSPMVSRLLHLAIVDILCTAISLRLGSSLRPVLHDIKRELRTKRRAPAR